MDVPGTVEAVGQNVTQFQTGDELFGICDGSAEYAFTPQDMVARKPADLTFEQSAVPTQLSLSRHCASIKSGQRVLIVESSGGVGVFALQMSFAGVARLGTLNGHRAGLDARWEGRVTTGYQAHWGCWAAKVLIKLEPSHPCR